MTTKNLLLRPVREIFLSPHYLIAWLVLIFVIFSLALFYPNLPTISYLWTQGQLSVGFKFNFLMALYGGALTNFSYTLLTTTIIITALTATQIILLYQLIKTQGRLIVTIRKSGTITFLGAVLATLGLGCAACGALILGSLLSITGGSWILTYLPWHGQEVAFLAIFILSLSNYFLLRQLIAPKVCT
jgi:hypothetical protein